MNFMGRIINFTISCFFSILIIYYLKNLENIGCKCALNFKHDYILYFTSFVILFGFLNLLFNGLRMFRIFTFIIAIPYIIAAIVNLVFTIQYVNEMTKINCDCSESVLRTLMYFLAIINVCAWIILLILIIFIFKNFGKENKKQFYNIFWKQLHSN